MTIISIDSGDLNRGIGRLIHEGVVALKYGDDAYPELIRETQKLLTDGKIGK